MSPYLKSAGMVAFVAVLLSIAQIWSGFQGIAATGSGGLGAVSFGISEFFVEFAVLTVAVWAVIYWRSKRVQALGRQTTQEVRENRLDTSAASILGHV